MTMEDVRKYETQLQQQTNSLLQESIPNNSDTSDAPEVVTKDPNPNLSVTSSPPLTPKSPAKRGYFSWF